MSYLLRDPTAVLLVGGGDGLAADFQSALLSGTATAVDDVRTVDEAREAVAERDDVGCVLLTDADDRESVGAACDALREVARNLPLVAYVDDADGTVATELASRTHCRYLPRTAPLTAVRDVVDDALDAYDRRRREAAESSLFRTLLEEADAHVFAKDERGRHLYKSDLARGRPPSDVVGKTDVEIADPGFEKSARAAYADDMDVLATGEGIYGQEERGGRGNEEYWSLVTKVPWRDDGGDVQGLVGLAFDVTRWKELERRLEAQQRRVDQFASYLRHDLRTPLQVAYGALELARDGDDEALDKIERAHERMAEVVEALSGLSARGTSTSHLPDEAYDAVGLGLKSIYLASLIEDLWTVYGRPESELVLDLPADAVVVAPPATARPLFENLLKNAVEHAGPDVTVRVGTTDGRTLFVEDDGPGLPDGLAAALSDHDDADVDDLAGTGLPLVLAAARELGWTVDAGESDGGGTRIELRGCSLITGAPTHATPAAPVELSESADVGSDAVGGAANYDHASDRWIVEGCGADVWGDTAEFHFVYGTATAPVRIEGRVDWLDGVHEFSKAGLMIRAGLAEDAPFSYVGNTDSHGSEVTWRDAADAAAESELFEERPLAFQWYRLDYVDDEVTCYLSDDGNEWHAVDQRSIDLGDEVAVGMSVCSHDAERPCEASFRNVRAWELELL